MRVTLARAAVVAGLLLPGAACAQPAQPVSQIQQILSDTAIWGADLPRILPFIPKVRAFGDSIIEVFTNRLQSQRAFATRDSAAARASLLSTALRAATPRASPQFAPLIARGAGAEVSPQVVMSTWIEDRKWRLVWALDTRLLRADVQIASIVRRYGKAVVRQITVQTDSDRRPAVLTLSSYADGAVTFIESDYGKAGVVDRVALNVAKLSGLLFPPQ